MNTTPTKAGRIPVKSIEIDRVEGPSELCTCTTHKTWEEAEDRIESICETAPATGGYHKTDFRIQFADGEIYQGRFDAMAGAAAAKEEQPTTLRGHLIRALGFKAGLFRPQCYTAEQYQKAIREHKAEVLDYIRKYDFPGLLEPEPEPETPPQTIFKYSMKMNNPSGFDWADPFEFMGHGDTFGEAVADLITAIRKSTLNGVEDDTVSQVIDTALDAWVNQVTGAPLWAQRREFSDPESDFDLWIFENHKEGAKS